MANICSFSMCVKGNKDDIQKFYNAMTQNGKVYMGRGADANIQYEDEEGRALIDGWCKMKLQSFCLLKVVSSLAAQDMTHTIWKILRIQLTSLPKCLKQQILIRKWFTM